MIKLLPWANSWWGVEKKRTMSLSGIASVWTNEYIWYIIICVWANPTAPGGLQGQNLPRKPPWGVKHSLYLSDWFLRYGARPMGAIGQPKSGDVLASIAMELLPGWSSVQVSVCMRLPGASFGASCMYDQDTLHPLREHIWPLDLMPV